MFASKKINLLVIALLLTTVSFSQKEKDLGLLLSTQDLSRFGIEYRMQKTEQLKLKFAAFYGQRNSSNLGGFANIYFVTDSAIYFRDNVNRSNNGAIQFGVERQMKSSIFSFSADLNVTYTQNQKKFLYTNRNLNLDNEWGNGWSTSDIDPLNPTIKSVEIKQHFIEPNLRFGFNINIPLSDELILSFSGISSIGIPIYMGATNRFDPNNEFGGNPPSIINTESLGIVGLRYVLGEKAK